MEAFYYSPANVQAYVEFLESKLPEALTATINLHPNVTNWARNGKDVLIGSAVQLFSTNKATIFPDAPVPVKSTTTKAKSVMMKIEAKAPVVTEAIVEQTVEPEVVSV
jgi:hypothetical protein